VVNVADQRRGRGLLRRQVGLVDDAVDERLARGGQARLAAAAARAGGQQRRHLGVPFPAPSDQRVEVALRQAELGRRRAHRPPRAARALGQRPHDVSASLRLAPSLLADERQIGHGPRPARLLL
jgi:hypothetical protein